MEQLADPKQSGGFSLAEMMIATLLFGLIITGFAAIYGTAYSQSGRVVGEARVQGRGAYAARAILKSIENATVIDEPAANARSNALLGCQNVAFDGSSRFQIVPAWGVSSFFFCARQTAGDGCTETDCIFMYKFTGLGNCPPPIPTVCGEDVGGVAPELIAENISTLNTPPDADPSMVNYFSRVSADKVPEGNTVRVGFKVIRDATNTAPELEFVIDTQARGEFSVVAAPVP